MTPSSSSPFGGPEGSDDVLPFLENVTRGRNIPRDRLLDVAAHYERFGGVSPLNGEIRVLLSKLVQELNARGPHLPVYWGNRNWHPMLTEAVQQMADDGIRHALAFTTSAFGSYSSCRQYREDIARARQEVGGEAPQIDVIRRFYNHPGFIEPVADRVRAALGRVPGTGTRTAATRKRVPRRPCSSPPTAFRLPWPNRAPTKRSSARPAGSSPLRSRTHSWQLVFQSRSGPPSQPWLGPDIESVVRAIAAKGETHDICWSCRSGFSTSTSRLSSISTSRSANFANR